MKLAVLGATGGTGKCLVQQALAAGHQVMAIVRNPAKLADLKDDNLQIKEGNIFSSDALHPLLQGCDAVLSCLGTNSLFSTVTIYSESCQAIVAAMRQASVKRFVFIASWYLEVEPSDDPGFVARWFIRPMLKKTIKDMLAMEQYLTKECSDIDYTSVRAPGLTNKNISEKEFLIEERQFVDATPMIGRADVARFMLQCLTTDEYNKKCIAFGYRA